MVLAVNGYNEPRETVAGFVRDKGLKQKVLLGGRQVALQAYGVKGFPTSFFIDRAGNVVASEVGFSPAGARGFEARIQEILREDP